MTAQPVELASEPLDPDTYAAQLMADVAMHDMGRDRSRLSDSAHLGVSGIGVCHEQARRMWTGDTPTDAPSRYRAVLGTWVDAGIKAARRAGNDRLIFDHPVTVTLPSGVTLLGHPDEVDPDECSVTDYKTVDEEGLALVRRGGAKHEHRLARHVYYLGAHQAGLVPADGIVRNIYLDRSGRDPVPYVEQEPFDMAVVDEADNWLRDVLYAIEHGEEASKDKPVSWCVRFCPFATSCRAGDHTIPGYYDDPDILTAAAAHLATTAEEKAAKLTRKGAADVLNANEVNGVCGDVVVRRTWVNDAPKRCKCGCGQSAGYHKVETEESA